MNYLYICSVTHYRFRVVSTDSCTFRCSFLFPKEKRKALDVAGAERGASAGDYLPGSPPGFLISRFRPNSPRTSFKRFGFLLGALSLQLGDGNEY